VTVVDDPEGHPPHHAPDGRGSRRPRRPRAPDRRAEVLKRAGRLRGRASRGEKEEKEK
jgi:hypothetical protein